ncbi:MAG TPA: hypothetical protein VJ719_07145 [Chthoniobacterales bacterium]|nr:hypothetical protein [Chthoniobacterales bacterium]
MKTMLGTTSVSLFALICLAGQLLAQNNIKHVPEVLSPLWLAIPVAGMFVYRYIRAKKS